MFRSVLCCSLSCKALVPPLVHVAKGIAWGFGAQASAGCGNCPEVQHWGLCQLCSGNHPRSQDHMSVNV